MEGIDIKIYHVGVTRDIILIRVNGYVDTTTSPELQKTIAQFIEKSFYKFIVDLAEVQYVSSAGWGVFVGEIRGLREKGGDLKLTQMTAEVLDVFEMLEFNRILTSYDSVTEAIDDFDFISGIPFIMERNISNSHDMVKSEKALPFQEQKDVMVAEPAPETHEALQEESAPSFPRHRTTMDSDLPLSEKLKKLVIENPALSFWALKKLLYSPRFGYTKIGYFKIRSVMKKLGLETKSKRYRFYRSRG